MQNEQCYWKRAVLLLIFVRIEQRLKEESRSPFLILDGARSGRAAVLLLQSVYLDSFVTEHPPKPEN